MVKRSIWMIGSIGWPILLVTGLWACSSDGRPIGSASNLDPEASELIAMANAAVERQRYDLAAEYLEELDAKHPNLAESAMTWGRIYFAAGRLEEADSAYRRVVELKPDEPGIYHNLGTVAFRARRYRDAIELFRQEAERYPEPRPYHAMGLAFDRLAMADSARWAYEQAIATDSTFAQAYASLARWFETSGKFEEAADFAIRAHALEPRNEQYEILKGRMLIRAGRYRDGVVILTPIVERDPFAYRPGFALGRAWQMLGDDEKAQVYIEQAGRAREIMQDIEAKMELLEDVPENLNARLELAEALRRVGRLDQSIVQYQFIERMLPENLGVKANLATLFMLTGDTTSALRRYDEILARDSSFVEVWINLCQHYVRTGQTQKALEALGEAKRYGAENPRVVALEDWVSENLE